MIATPGQQQDGVIACPVSAIDLALEKSNHLAGGKLMGRSGENLDFDAVAGTSYSGLHRAFEDFTADQLEVHALGLRRLSAPVSAAAGAKVGMMASIRERCRGRQVFRYNARVQVDVKPRAFP
jgi:hypothetical protein